jgi:phosphatidylglycerol:prolipoprotein diacylglycerol transferase
MLPLYYHALFMLLERSLLQLAEAKWEPRYYYTLFMFAASVVFLVVRHFVPRPPALQLQPLWKRCVLGMAAFIGGSLGGKVPFVLGLDSGTPDLFGWLQDGKTITTGLIGAYLAVELAKVYLQIHVKTGDTYALPLACAMAVGRWGCFFNGCCYGTETTLPWGCTFRDGLSRHPTQIYESLFHLGTALILLLLLRTGILRFQHLKLYLICYGVYRFLTEYIRPEPQMWLGLTFYQWVSVALIVGLSVQWWFDSRATIRVRKVPSLPA